MRELTYEEMEQVDGGVVPFAIALGAAHGAYSGYQSGGVGGAIAGAAFGAATGVFGGVAVAARGAARVMFSAYSFGTHAIQQEAMEDLSRRRGGIS